MGVIIISETTEIGTSTITGFTLSSPVLSLLHATLSLSYIIPNML